jgi:hypothetical protein
VAAAGSLLQQLPAQLAATPHETNLRSLSIFGSAFRIQHKSGNVAVESFSIIRAADC